MTRRLQVVLPLLAVLASACGPPDGGTGPDAETALVLGAPDSLLFWRGQKQLDGYRHMDRVFPTRTIRAGDEVLDLGTRPVDFSTLSFEWRDEAYDVDRFVEENAITGLLVIHRGDIVLERYERGHSAATKWVGYSISKSVVSLLVGAAVRDGYITDLDAPVSAYVPALAEGAYSDVTIRHALTMSSGVAWSDGYADLAGDINTSLTAGTLPLLDRLADRERIAEPGTRWNYNTGETHLLGTVLRAAIGNNLSEYLSQKIWEPFGMEADAHWMLVEPGGGEHGGCCFSATLRDYGRLGLFAMGGGRLADGTEVLADGWMEESLAASPANSGYGYLWWLQPGGAFAAIGIFGQMVWVDPAAEVVVVTHSAWDAATAHFGRGYLLAAAARDLLAAEGR